MGILNITPDSFFDGGKYQHKKAILTQTEKMLKEGATFIDVGVPTHLGLVQITFQRKKNCVDSSRSCSASQRISRHILIYRYI